MCFRVRVRDECFELETSEFCSAAEPEHVCALEVFSSSTRFPVGVQGKSESCFSVGH